MGVGFLIPFRLRTSRIGGANFISTNRLQGGGMSTPSHSMCHSFRIFSHAFPPWLRMYRGQLQVDGMGSVYCTPLASSDAACSALVCTLEASFMILASSSFRNFSARSSSVRASCKAVAESSRDSTFCGSASASSSFSLSPLSSPSPSLPSVFADASPPDTVLAAAATTAAPVDDNPLLFSTSSNPRCRLLWVMPPISASFSSFLRFARDT
mmetsp:Transcript_11477/g.24210  ORF Transcript_11477/g.24210 Transcript_11477/m.24210 type:complete len:211 (-) Transcript_11477:474-1106(-)